MRRPVLTNWDQALIAIWAVIGLPIIVTSWLEGVLVPGIWSNSDLLITQIYESAFLLLLYGLPVVIVVRLAIRALR